MATTREPATARPVDRLAAASAALLAVPAAVIDGPAVALTLLALAAGADDLRVAKHSRPIATGAVVLAMGAATGILPSVVGRPPLVSTLLLAGIALLVWVTSRHVLAGASTVLLGLGVALLTLDVLSPTVLDGSAVTLAACVLLAGLVGRPGFRRARDPQLTLRYVLAAGVAAPAGLLAAIGAAAPEWAPLAVVISVTLYSLVLFLVSRQQVEDERTTTSAQQLARIITDAADTSILTVDERGTILEANDAATTLLAGEGGTLVGISVEELVPPSLRQRHVEDRARFAHSGRLRAMGETGPVIARTLEGRELAVEIGLARSVGPEGVRFIAVLRDLTAREDERARLEAEVARQEAHVAQLTRLENMRQELLAAASHELRTPLTVIHGTAELLAARAGDVDRELLAELLERQLAQTARLASLIDDLLTTDPRMQVKTHPEAVQLHDAVVHEVARWRRGHHDARVSVHPHPAVGWIDPVSLQRVLGVLLDNAVRHGEPPIVVRVRGDRRGAYVEVADHGPGIPQALASSVLEPFGRGARIDPANPGLGLGLPLARVLAEADGGVLRVVPADHGCRVRLEVPAPPTRVEVVELDDDGEEIIVGSAATPGSPRAARHDAASPHG